MRATLPEMRFGAGAALVVTTLSGGCALSGYDLVGTGAGAEGGGAAGGTGAEGGAAGGAGAHAGGDGGAGARGGQGGAGGGSYLGPCPGAPSAAQMFDDFDDAQTSASKWYVDEPVSFGMGDVAFEPGFADGYAAIDSVLDVDLEECAVQIEVRSLLGKGISGTETFLSFRTNGEQELSIVADGLVLHSVVGDPNGPYDEVEHAFFQVAENPFWRIEERNDRVYFRVSADGYTWSDLRNVPTPEWGTLGYIQIGVWMDTNSISSASEARLDNMNLPPSE